MTTERITRVADAGHGSGRHWFAWRPVRLRTGELAWLRRVWRLEMYRPWLPGRKVEYAAIGPDGFPVRPGREAISPEELAWLGLGLRRRGKQEPEGHTP
jgi:hypothetical protein